MNFKVEIFLLIIYIVNLLYSWKVFKGRIIVCIYYVINVIILWLYLLWLGKWNNLGVYIKVKI